MKKILLIGLMLGLGGFMMITTTVAQNLVQNPGLETWTNTTTPANWTTAFNITQESTTIHGGTYSAKHTSDATTMKLVQDVSGVTAGTVYTISYWYYDNDPAATTRRWFYWLSGSTTLLDPLTDTLFRPSTYSTDNPSWVNWTASVTAPAGADGFRMDVRVYKENSTTGGSVFYDDFSLSSGGTTLPEPTNYPTSFVANAASNALTITLTWIDATGGQVPQAYLIKASDVDNIVAPVDGTPVTDDLDFTDGQGAKNVVQGSQTCTFNGLNGNKTYYFKIYPYTNNGSIINYKTDGTPPAANAHTADITVVLSKNFEDNSLAPWDTVQVAGTRGWTISSFSNNYFAKANAFNSAGTVPVEDWLISPSMNFNSFQNEKLTFMTAMNYAVTTGGPFFEAKMSTDYVSGDPTAATWTTLTAALSTGTYTWIPSGTIDVSSFNGTNVHLAFRYTCTTSAEAWEVDDILITGDSLVGIREYENKEVATIYPNPTSGRFTVRVPDGRARDISIYSVVGTTVYSTTSSAIMNTIELPSVQKGVYFVQVTDLASGKKTVTKLFVE